MAGTCRTKIGPRWRTAREPRAERSTALCAGRSANTLTNPAPFPSSQAQEGHASSRACRRTRYWAGFTTISLALRQGTIGQASAALDAAQRALVRRTTSNSHLNEAGLAGGEPPLLITSLLGVIHQRTWRQLSSTREPGCPREPGCCVGSRAKDHHLQSPTLVATTLPASVAAAVVVDDAVALYAVRCRRPC